MTDRGESLLSRWSRLKRAGGGQPDREAAGPAQPEVPAEAPAPPEAEAEELPPIDSLGRDSDYSVFMRQGVPEELKRLALRKLWASDPVYANLDGLVEYGEDFGEPFRASPVIATLYRVGEGMMPPIEEAQPAEHGDASGPAGSGSAVHDPNGTSGQAAGEFEEPGGEKCQPPETS